MEALPIDAVLPEVLAAAATGAFVLVAPPGAGKTTRVPPALLDRLDGEIWMLEPRRVAARAAARRIADERGWKLGEQVGYQVRFESVVSARTRIRVVTEGVLLRRLQEDPFLSGVGAVLLDEVHERGLDADLSLALLAEVRREVRPDLVLGAMSATIDAGPLGAFLGAGVVVASGRAYPVEVSYLPLPDERPVEDLAADGIRKVLAEGPGDVLGFLPGVREIRRVAERLAGLPVDVVPLYGDLPPEQQDAALRPGPRRRVVLATNVAETSVTVPGVTVVVDTGLARRPRLDPSTGLDRLETVRISRASADQRAGRAGRTAPGRCLRLWTERLHRTLPDADPPEVARVDLAGPALQLWQWGADPRTFGWFEAPPPGALDAALVLLSDLGAVDRDGLTTLGRQLAGLPLHPRLGRMVLEGHALGHPPDAALAAALLSERDPLRGGFPSTSSPSDVLDRVDAVLQDRGEPGPRRQALRARDQVLRALPRAPVATVEREEALGRAVLAGWPDRVARRRGPGDDRARMVGGKGVVLDRQSAVRDAPLFVCVDVDGAGVDARVRIASAVEPGWLPVQTRTVLVFDQDARAVRARRVTAYRDLELASLAVPADPAAAADLLVEHAAARLAEVLPEDEGQLLTRLRCLAEWLPESWPAIDDDLLRSLLPELATGRRSFDELARADWAAAIWGRLGWDRKTSFERLAPERLEVPSGSSIRLRYEVGRPPVLAVRIQELFGQLRTPTVADGRVKVLLHLLAPNQRPQQVTDDLEGFWARTWPEVRKELRARYPKHAWPEDPRTARAERRPGQHRPKPAP